MNTHVQCAILYVTCTIHFSSMPRTMPLFYQPHKPSWERIFVEHFHLINWSALLLRKPFLKKNKIVMAIEWHAFELCRLQSSSLVLQHRKCHFGCMTFHFICHFPMKLFKLMFFMHFKLTFIPNSLILNLSAINRSMGSTERSPKYTRFCSDNLKRNNRKNHNSIEHFNSFISH